MVQQFNGYVQVDTFQEAACARDRLRVDADRLDVVDVRLLALLQRLGHVHLQQEVDAAAQVETELHRRRIDCLEPAGRGRREVQRGHKEVTQFATQGILRAQRAAEAGVFGYLVKPFREQDLVPAIRTARARHEELVALREEADSLAEALAARKAIERAKVLNNVGFDALQRGDLVITVSTSGKSPALAKKLRHELERRFGEEYAVLLDLLGAIRKRLLAQEHAPEAHKSIFENIIHSDILTWIRDSRMQEVNRLLKQVLGDGWRAEELLAKADD